MARIGPQGFADLAQALWQLGLARWRLRRQGTRDLLAAERADATPDLDLTPQQRELISRVSFAIPRAGAYAPWRTDCLIQALAARQWLQRHGVATRLHIGVRLPNGADFEAHAWLMAGAEAVTGGTGEGYAGLIAS